MVSSWSAMAVSRVVLALLMASSAMCTTPTGDYVWEHNVVRCLHCDTPIARLSASLEADAQAYAATCPTGHAERSARNGAGENLYWAGGSLLGTVEQSYRDAMQGWYTEEEVNYDYTTGRGNGGGITGHFTQVVWKDSVEIGCAVNLNCNNMFGGGQNSAVVCRYLPAGNFNNNYLTQVGDKLTMGTQCTTAHSTCANIPPPDPSIGGGTSPSGPSTGGGGGNTPSSGGGSGGSPGAGGGGSSPTGGDAESAMTVFIIMLAVGLTIFLIPLALSLHKGRGKDNSFDESDRWLLIGVECASIILVMSCAEAGQFGRLSASRLSAAACAFGIVSLAAATLLLGFGSLGRLHPRTGNTAFSFFFAAWWTAGAITMTFYGPFTVTSNGYFACWAALFFSGTMLVATLGRIAAEQAETAKAALREKRSLAGLLVSSAVMIGACVSRVYMLSAWGAALIYALVCAIITMVCVVGMLLAATRLPELPKALLALTLFGMWLATLYLTTFGTGQFSATSNGFFAAWMGVIFAALLLISDGRPLLTELAKIRIVRSAEASKAEDAATKAKDGSTVSVETRRAIDRQRIEPPSTAFPSCKAAESTSATAAEVKVDVSRHSGNV